MTYSSRQLWPSWTPKSPQEPLVNDLTLDSSMGRDRLQLETLDLFLISKQETSSRAAMAGEGGAGTGRGGWSQPRLHRLRNEK